jgi:hypothetical protein
MPRAALHLRVRRRPAHPRSYLEGVEAGRRVTVFRLDPVRGERLNQIATAATGEGGWVDLAEPLIVRAGDGFVAVPEEGT